ncbi:epoxyqueuosine reductase QueG [Paenibacillus sp. DS2015]
MIGDPLCVALIEHIHPSFSDCERISRCLTVCSWGAIDEEVHGTVIDSGQ